MHAAAGLVEGAELRVWGKERKSRGERFCWAFAVCTLAAKTEYVYRREENSALLKTNGLT